MVLLKFNYEVIVDLDLHEVYHEKVADLLKII